MDDWGPRRAIIGGLYAAVATGGFYGFSVYSLALKHQCGLSQSALANINTLPYGLGVLSPLIVMLGRPLGLRGNLFIGGLLCASALVTQYILATHCTGAVRAAAPVILVLCSCVTYIGTQFVTSVAFPVPVCFWPVNRAQVTATVKSFVGLGGAAVAQTYRVLYGTPSEDPIALRCLLLWAVICAGVQSPHISLLPRPSLALTDLCAACRSRPSSAQPARGPAALSSHPNLPPSPPPPPSLAPPSTPSSRRWLS